MSNVSGVADQPQCHDGGGCLPVLTLHACSQGLASVESANSSVDANSNVDAIFNVDCTGQAEYPKSTSCPSFHTVVSSEDRPHSDPDASIVFTDVQDKFDSHSNRSDHEQGFPTGEDTTAGVVLWADFDFDDDAELAEVEELLIGTLAHLHDSDSEEYAHDVLHEALTFQNKGL